MGVSTDAILFYGFPLDDEDKQFEDGYPWEREYKEICDFIAEKYGYKGDDNWGFADKLKVIIGYHCCEEEEMYYIAIEESIIKANRGFPKEISNLNIKPNWDKQLQEFYSKLKIKVDKSKWWMVSNWV